jgi:hypothetical protein
MRIGILGSGLMGGKLGTIFARAGHDVVFSYARSNDKLKRLARDAGPSRCPPLCGAFAAVLVLRAACRREGRAGARSRHRPAERPTPHFFLGCDIHGYFQMDVVLFLSRFTKVLTAPAGTAGPRI